MEPSYRMICGSDEMTHTLNCLAPDSRLQAIADLIETWEQVYPISLFPELPKGEHGDTVDACSARMGRFMVGLLRDALTEDSAPIVGSEPSLDTS